MAARLANKANALGQQKAPLVPISAFCCTHCPQMVDISKPYCSLVRTCKLAAAAAIGLSAHRIISVYDFESENGYEMDSDDGKPLSAYKFAISNATNTDFPIRKALNEIVSEDYSKEWNQLEVEEIAEPHNG